MSLGFPLNYHGGGNALNDTCEYPFRFVFLINIVKALNVDEVQLQSVFFDGHISCLAECVVRFVLIGLHQTISLAAALNIVLA